MKLLVKVFFTGAVICSSSFSTQTTDSAIQNSSVQPKKQRLSQPPNILLIMTDQHNAQYLNCLGNKHLRTPNLDELASKSVIFRSAYTASPVCGPSRASVFTGQYPFRNGVYTNWVPINKNSVLLTERLAQAGYYNIMIGKLHLTPVDSAHGFNYRKICESPYDLYDKKEVLDNDYLPVASAGMGITSDKLVEIAGESEHSPVTDPFFWIGRSWAEDKYQMTTWTGNESVSAIRNYENKKPFFMHVSFFGPHHPYTTCEPWNSMYDPDKIELPPTIGMIQPGAQQGFRADWPDSLWRKIIARYSGNISAIDFQVGRIIAALKEKGLWENTLIVFTADHGDHMGDFSELGKGTMLESSVRVPFLIKPPGPKPVKRECKQIINLIDLYSTFLDYAGISDIPGSDSKTIRTLLKDGSGWDNKTFSSFCSADGRNGQVMAIQGKFKCVGFINDGTMNTELYDLTEKPADLHNLAGNPDYEKVHSDMKTLLGKWVSSNTKN